MSASPRFRRRWPLREGAENRDNARPLDAPATPAPQHPETLPTRPPRARVVATRRARPGSAPEQQTASDNQPVSAADLPSKSDPAMHGAATTAITPARRVRIAALPKAKVARVLRRVRGQGPALGSAAPGTETAHAPEAAPDQVAPVGDASTHPDRTADAVAYPPVGGAEKNDGETPRTAAEVQQPAIPPAPETRRAAGETAAPRSPAPRLAPADATARQAQVWDALDTFSASSAHLDRHRVVAALRDDAAHAAFDLLRTRLLHTLADRGWKRVAITSPTARCGKTFTAANLAISLSRQENCRTILLDLDLRRPSLHGTLGQANPASIGDMLRGDVAPADHLLRLGANDFDGGHGLAVGFNGRRERFAAELMQDPRTARTLSRIESEFTPDVMLFDLPPALYTDDVMALQPHFDGVILVLGGGITTPKEVKAVERRLGDKVPLLGMVLNMAEDGQIQHYPY
ncbi:exopolysaccharide biosynthesis protein [Citreimonas sp.]|uniref:tyrosine-protein kinase family protein n=1 Tax=Citreimonas sp. TaxID=3036715 RepID=UPI0035C7ED3A